LLVARELILDAAHAARVLGRGKSGIRFPDEHGPTHGHAAIDSIDMNRSGM
jgi:hypothetical protein